MRIILDMVIDKTSTQHWWYKDFIQGKNDFYIAKDWKENDCDPGIGSRSIYNWDSRINKWVVSPFGGFLPALNVNNPDVRNEIAKVLRFWLSKGDNIDLQSNILSINDLIDGNLSYSSDVSEDSLNYYTFSYDNLSSIGSHDVIVTAVDKSGNISTATFKVNVQKKPKPVEVARVNSTINVPDNVSGNDIVQIAYKYIGYPYVSGANGPYSFDCSGFVQFVYSQVGKSISRSTSTQILDGVGISYDSVQPGDILSWGYTDGVPTHSALYVGNGMMIHAANPSQGVLLSNVAAWTRGSGTRVISVRRIG